jgi:hypothetical protein
MIVMSNSFRAASQGLNCCLFARIRRTWRLTETLHADYKRICELLVPEHLPAFRLSRVYLPGCGLIVSDVTASARSAGVRWLSL